MSRTGLVMEGGAMRGMYTTGVIDVMMENGITYDGAIGVSAGAVFGCNYKSHQIGRPIRYNKRFCKDKTYCSVRSLLTTGDIYGANMCYNVIPYKLDKFDIETYRANPMTFTVVATDCETGKPVYKQLDMGDGEDMLWFRASASMPMASRPVEIGGRTYLDGGTTDSIPLEYFEKAGYDKNVVIMTQPDGYRKGPARHRALMKVLLARLPAVYQAMIDRPAMYNAQLAYVKEAEKEGRAFAIYPPEPLNIGATCDKPEELERVYQIGRRTCEERLDDLKRFLGL